MQDITASAREDRIFSAASGRKRFSLAGRTNGSADIADEGKKTNLSRIPEELDLLDTHGGNTGRRTDDQDRTARLFRALAIRGDGIEVDAEEANLLLKVLPVDA